MNNWQRQLDQSVDMFLDELLRLRQHESFLIYVDRGSDYHLADAICSHAGKRAARSEIFELDSQATLANQAQQLTEKISRGSYNVICELSEQYFYLSSAWRQMRQIGARVYSLAGLDSAAFIRCVGRVDHQRMFELGIALNRELRKCRSLRIYTAQGTDIQMRLQATLLNRISARLGCKSRPYILQPCGILNDSTRTTFLGGQLAFQPISSTIRGTAVFDGYLWPPAEIGLLDKPIIIRIKKGIVTQIGGCPDKAEILTRWFKGKTISIEHFCIGFNPGATLSGHILEAERAFGCITVGMGKGSLHTDGVMSNCSMEANYGVILRNGSFVSTELSSFERDLLLNR